MSGPDPEQIQHLIRQEFARLGRGAWRVNEDAVDAAYDRIVDRWGLLARGARLRDLHAYTRAVCRNLVHREPRGELSRRRTASLGDLDPSDVAIHFAQEQSSGRVLDRRVLSRLTTAERRAVEAVFVAWTVAEAAAIAGMTRRDLRVRLHRAAAKIRAVVEHAPSPLGTHGV